MDHFINDNIFEPLTLIGEEDFDGKSMDVIGNILAMAQDDDLIEFTI